MKTEWLEQWARILVRYSIAVEKGSVIKVRGTTEAAPLIRAVYAELLRAGAHPRVSVMLPGLLETFYRHGSNDQLSYLSPVDRYEARTIDGIIFIKSQVNTRELSGIAAAKQVLTAKAAKPLSDLIIKKDNWVLTLFPTAAYAQDADMSLDDFESFVARSQFLDRQDPVKAWKTLSRQQAVLVKRLNKVKSVRILAPDTDLTLSIDGRTAINSDGRRNMPSGEVFTSPVETSAEGYIRYTFPAVAYGREISGIYLEFSRGKVVKCSAEKNEPFLRKMLEIDRGARYLGELGIGTNYGITAFTRNILFDEKIGGTIHLALGNGSPECGGKNKSALHWDMIKDLRTDGELYFDGTLVQKNGRFLQKSLAGLA
jgi:aminopeptidase